MNIKNVQREAILIVYCTHTQRETCTYTNTHKAIRAHMCKHSMGINIYQQIYTK